ncbi:MAG: PPK2 family polyphosphate kinase [Actinomycetota bacterium]
MATESERWLVRPGEQVDLGSVDTRSTAGAPGDKDETSATFADLDVRLAGLQERLWAERRQSLLLVLQAMDAGGKDGTAKHLLRPVHPIGCRAVSFRVPSAEEAAHDFLWRVHKRTPAKGEIVVFNRSHYEDVLVVRVHSLVPEEVWRPRYRLISDFEANLAAAGTKVVKVFLHVSREEQARRFHDRLVDPTKRWKFRAGDLDDRARWDDFRAAYTEAIERTTTEASPWYVVPADRKWYRNWAVSNIVIETLEAMAPAYPPGEEGIEDVVVPP